MMPPIAGDKIISNSLNSFLIFLIDKQILFALSGLLISCGTGHIEDYNPDDNIKCPSKER